MNNRQAFTFMERGNGSFCGTYFLQRNASLFRVGVTPKHWTNGMLGFPPTEENQHEEEQIYR